MIPKKIHYCWLSGDRKPEKIKKCMESWKKVMPDYEIKLWDTTNFDINSNKFVYEACKAKKWAFASDYIRLWALYHEGGIYLDSDVVVKKGFDGFLNYDFFSSVEYHSSIIRSWNSRQYLNPDATRREGAVNVPGIGLQAAIMGAKMGNQFIKACMDFYENRNFILENEKLFTKIIAPDIYAKTAEKFGFKYKNTNQLLDGNFMIFTSDIFAGSYLQTTEKSYAVHHCIGSWRSKKKDPLPIKIQKKINWSLQLLAFKLNLMIAK
jgi:hypothetical protein